MTVSIILKTLNEEKRIAAAIESTLQALPGQTPEVIVADSGSTDRTVDIASGYPIKVVQIQAPARASCGIGPQLGFQYSRHDFVCLMDGDMLLAPDFLEHAIAFLDAHPDVAGVTGHVLEMNLDNLEFSRRVRRAGVENRIGPIDRMNGGGLYRRAAIKQVDYFTDRNLHGYEEFDLGIRLSQKGWKLHRMDRPFVEHFGHTINAYLLLVRRWKSKYIRGIGELLRAALGKPHMNLLVHNLPELRLWAVVYALALGIVASLVFVPDRRWAIAIAIGLVVLPVAAMSVKQRSLARGFYAVVAWCFHAAALPLGFFGRRSPPDAWIESKILTDKT